MQRLALLPFPLRVLGFIIGLALIWLPPAGIIHWVIQDSNSEAIALMVWLLLAFIIQVIAWGRWLYRCPNLFKAYGLDVSWQQGIALSTGLVIGMLSVLLLMGLQWTLGWITITAQFDSRMIAIVLEGAIVAIAIGIGEELVFRGWLLDELERDYPPRISLWASSIMFAVLHFIKPWEEIVRTFPQFPGLVLLGLLLVWAKRSQQGQLGIAIGLHAGLVWAYYLFQVGQLIQYQASVPEGWSGIDQNPLAGGLGLCLLGLLAVIARTAAQRSKHAKILSSSVRGQN